MNAVAEILLSLPDAPPGSGPEPGLDVFNHVLRSGVRIPVRTGLSIRETIIGELGIPADYLDEVIQTIFLQSSPVDDPESSIIRDGSVLALSAAMPGLLGAVMRRAGTFSPLRCGITHHDTSRAGVADGSITLKLFNTVLEDLRELILGRGCFAPSGEILFSIGSSIDTVDGIRVSFNAAQTSLIDLKIALQALPSDSPVRISAVRSEC